MSNYNRLLLLGPIGTYLSQISNGHSSCNFTHRFVYQRLITPNKTKQLQNLISFSLLVKKCIKLLKVN